MTEQPSGQLPVFYSDLAPLNSKTHAGFRFRRPEKSSFIAGHNFIPLTAEEFGTACLHYPIIFSVGDNPVPLALMGLDNGVNVFLDNEGQFAENVYVPAYVRRYPFILARLTHDSEELTLCVDPESIVAGFDHELGEPLFENETPTETTSNILQFCERFEQAGNLTGLFTATLKELDLLMDGEIAIQQTLQEAPFIYRGFRMVNEDKLKELKGNDLRRLNQNGMLGAIFAHLVSLNNIQRIFERQQNVKVSRAS